MFKSRRMAMFGVVAIILICMLLVKTSEANDDESSDPINSCIHTTRAGEAKSNHGECKKHDDDDDGFDGDDFDDTFKVVENVAISL